MKFKRLTTIMLSLLSPTAFAEISTDGTVGPAQTLGANNGQFTIGQDLGSLKGNNLFHSFKQFNVNTGESATFTGNDAIKNVISRVTGGNESVINGLLQSKIGTADFYFINPSGVVFGENAQIDVPSAFHMSTAGELKFADGSSFNALNPETSTLSIAAPEGFGFAKGQNSNLQIIGGQLSFKPGTDVSLSANNIKISGLVQASGDTKPSTITVQQTDSTTEQGIHLNLTAVDSEKTQILSITKPADIPMGGNISIERSVLNVSGNGFGLLRVRAGEVNIQNGALLADNTGIQPMNTSEGINLHARSLILENSILRNNALNEGNAGTVSVTVTNVMQVINGGQVSSAVSSAGDAGNIIVKTDQLTIEGQDQGSGGFTGIFSDVLSGTGNAGIVSVTVNESLQVLNGGQISSETFAEGSAGNISIEAKQLIIDRQNNKNLTGVFSNTAGTGNAGSVLVNVNETMQVLNGGRVSSSTSNEGNAKSVTVNADQLTINRQGGENLTGIFSEATSGTGNASNVSVAVANDINILNGGEVSSATISEGNAGNVTVDARQLTIDRQNSDKITGISSTALSGTGKAGNVLINTNEVMQILNGGQISSFTLTDSNAGDITISTGQLTIDSQGNENLTGIFSDAISGTGNAGAIKVTADQTMQVLNGGRVSSSTSTKGSAGNITVKADQLTIDSQDNTSTGIFSDALLGTGNAGTLLVTVNNSMQILGFGQVSSSTRSEGDAGSVNVEAGQLTIDGQDSESNIIGIFSEAQLGTGNAGSVFVTINKEMDILNGGRVSSSTFTEGHGGNVTVTAKQLTIDAQNSGKITGISSDALLGTGDAGTVSVSVNEAMQVINGGRVSSSTFTKGNAGNVSVETGQLTIAGDILNSGITSFSGFEASGKVGNVSVTASDQVVLLNGFISIASANQTLQPSIVDLNSTPEKIIINTPVLRLQNSSIDATANGQVNANPIELNVTNTLDVLNSQITTSAFNGNGAPITVNAATRVRLKNSQIATSVFGSLNGNGGDITLNTLVLLLDTGFIQANTQANLASGGDINLNVNQLVASGDSLLRGGSELLVFDSNLANFNVIQAASATGVNGNINIISPELNIVGDLAGVNIPKLDIDRVGRDPCASSRENSLKSLGHGGVPVFQNGENYLPINRFGKPKNSLEKPKAPSSATSVNQEIHPGISVECSKT